jgi:hypothetical protein
MGLPHFKPINYYNSYAAYCEICYKGGNIYGYGNYMKDGEVHDFCSKHAKEYEITYKNKIRKKKLEKICR